MEATILVMLSGGKSPVYKKSSLFTIPVRREPTSGDLDLLNWLWHHGIPSIPILTKADKLSRQKAGKQAALIKRQIKEVCPTAPIVFSAKTKQGRQEIWEQIHAACRDEAGERPGSTNGG